MGEGDHEQGRAGEEPPHDRIEPGCCKRCVKRRQLLRRSSAARLSNEQRGHAERGEDEVDDEEDDPVDDEERGPHPQREPRPPLAASVRGRSNREREDDGDRRVAGDEPLAVPVHVALVEPRAGEDAEKRRQDGEQDEDDPRMAPCSLHRAEDNAPFLERLRLQGEASPRRQPDARRGPDSELPYDRRVPGEPPDRPLDERELDPDPDPVAQFRRWLEEAEEKAIPLAEAATLATATADGTPSARVVLLKGLDDRGFVFYTNRESRKGRELAENARAALVFYWNELGRQVRVEGAVEEVAADEADAYFRTRPRGSRIGAWASPQSTAISGREELETRAGELEQRYGDDVPRPPFWGGFRVVPHTVEFWQHRENRLHDRFVYRRRDGGWGIERLAP